MRDTDEAPAPAGKAGGNDFLLAKAITRSDGVLGQIYQSATRFTVLTDLVRESVDGRMAPWLTVTGWADGTLRITLSRPALATRWRFQEPAVRRRLAREPAMRGLREVRLVLAGPAARPPERRAPSRLRDAPVGVIEEMASRETHPGLRRALLELAEAARQARSPQDPD